MKDIQTALTDIQSTTDLPGKAMKVSWTWDEWQKSRALRKAISLQIGPPVTRRRQSSSDPRLRSAFSGKRAP